MGSNRLFWVVGTLAIAGVLLAAPVFLIGGPRPVAVIETSLGTIRVELNPDRAPRTVDNFLRYADSKHYDGTLFHRVIQGFMIQGGGYTPGEFGPEKRKEKFPPIQSESYNGLKNERGTIAMARTSDPDSASAEFFINVVDNPFLDKERAKDEVGYTVFGRVVEGMDVVDRIRRLKTQVTDNGMQEVPVEPVIIKSVTIER